MNPKDEVKFEDINKMTDGKLLQTDKKYAQLKLKQKEKIAEWMFQVTLFVTVKIRNSYMIS